MPEDILSEVQQTELAENELFMQCIAYFVLLLFSSILGGLFGCHSEQLRQNREFTTVLNITLSTSYPKIITWFTH